ncbi:hypothetical protein [Microbacterium sp. NPDC058389]|uniref:hypothetical protein n=1 Tax=Microbacterium sp. NPDC058389 TaxID=3346475 RepID=UPI003664B100
MPRVTVRDLVAIAVFLGLVAIVAIFALMGNTAWALAALACLMAMVGVVSRIEFATRRGDLKSQRRDLQDVRRTVERIHRGAEQMKVSRAADVEQATQLVTSVAALHSEIRGMRVAQQLTSQTITATKSGVLESAHSMAELERRTAAIYDGIRARVRQPEVEYLDDLQGLYQLFSRFTPVAPLPSMAGSSLGAAGIYFVTDIIEQRQVDCVVHRGNRLTALWMAYALRLRGTGMLIVLEDDDDGVARTLALLTEHQLAGLADVRRVGTVTATPADSDAEVEGLPRGVDLLVLDRDANDMNGVDLYPDAALLRWMLRSDALLVVSDAERIDVGEVIRSWEEANSELKRVLSPRSDTAVLSWGMEATS